MKIQRYRRRTINRTNVEDTIFGVFSLFWIAVLLFAIIGWIMNIFDVVSTTKPLDLEDAMHILGLFIIPLGVIMGWFF